MKRKIIQMAGKTMVVSLPYDWVRKYNVHKGDEVNLEANRNTIEISLGKTAEPEKTLTLETGKGFTMLHRLIGAAYKAGYSSVEIAYHSPEEYGAIEKCLKRTLIGFEVIQKTSSRVVVKLLSKLDSNDFDNVLRRCFMSLLAMAEESLEHINKGNFDGLKEIVAMDDNINRYSDFCRRVLNTTDVLNYKRLQPLYYIVEQLERIGDEYRDIASYLIDHKFRPSSEIKEAYSEVNSYLRMFYKLFYEFNIDGLEYFGERRPVIEAMINKGLNKAKPGEMRVLHRLSKVFEAIFDMNGTIMTLFL